MVLRGTVLFVLSEQTVLRGTVLFVLSEQTVLRGTVLFVHRFTKHRASSKYVGGSISGASAYWRGEEV